LKKLHYAKNTKSMRTKQINSPKMTIRKANPAEAPLLSALALRSKAYWGYDAAFMEACREELTLTAEKIRRFPTFLIESSGDVLGFYNLEHINDREVELGYLFLEPQAIGKGFGGRLMQHAKETARQLGYQFMIIQGDPNAGGFYETFGGKKIGSRPSASIAGRELPVFRITL
jgi:predicted N-acetyltransferase YhbS